MWDIATITKNTTKVTTKETIHIKIMSQSTGLMIVIEGIYEE
jgi:hypothetical protein